MECRSVDDAPEIGEAAADRAAAGEPLLALQVHDQLEATRRAQNERQLSRLWSKSERALSMLIRAGPSGRAGHRGLRTGGTGPTEEMLSEDDSRQLQMCRQHARAP